MCLLGVSSKMVTLAPTIPKIPKILHYKSRFFAQNTHLGVSATKIRSRIGNSSWGFQILGKKIDRKWNSGRFCACAAENYLNWLKPWSNFQNFSLYRKLDTGISNLGSNFTPEVVLWPFLRIVEKHDTKINFVDNTVYTAPLWPFCDSKDI